MSSTRKKKSSKTNPTPDPQTSFDEVVVEDEELLLALETREANRAAVSTHRKATDVVKEIVGGRPSRA